MKGLNLLLVVAMLACYSFGASVMDGFVVYHGWLYTNEADFARAHQEDGVRIVGLFVLPLLVTTILTISLLWFRPPVLSKKLIWMAIGFQAIGWLSSAFIQIPIQFQLDRGKDMALLQKLIVTDWIRVVAGIGMMVVIISMLFRVTRKAVI